MHETKTEDVYKILVKTKTYLILVKSKFLILQTN